MGHCTAHVRKKEEKYRELIAERTCQFFGWVYDTYGALNPEASSLLVKIAEDMGNFLGISTSRALTQARLRLQNAVQYHVATILVAGTPAMRHDGDWRPCPGPM